MNRFEILKDGFNVAMLAEALGCSVGRINELKCEPVEGQVYHKADINYKAIASFALKHNVNIDAINFEVICANKKQTNEKIEVNIGYKTKIGEIINIQKVGNTFVYLAKTENGLKMLSNKELKEVL